MSDELDDLLEGFDESRPAPREAVRNMAPYSPPTSGRAGKLRLDFNENTVGASPQVIQALKKYLTADHLTIYPEYQNAMADLAQVLPRPAQAVHVDQWHRRSDPGDGQRVCGRR